MRAQWIPPCSQHFLESKTNTTRITLIMLSKSTTALMDPILSPNLMRNGHAVNAVLPVTGSIDPGSTIRPFAGTTRIFLTSNPRQVIFLMSTLLHIEVFYFLLGVGFCIWGWMSLGTTHTIKRRKLSHMRHHLLCRANFVANSADGSSYQLQHIKPHRDIHHVG